MGGQLHYSPASPRSGHRRNYYYRCCCIKQRGRLREWERLVLEVAAATLTIKVFTTSFAPSEHEIFSSREGRSPIPSAEDKAGRGAAQAWWAGNLETEVGPGGGSEGLGSMAQSYLMQMVQPQTPRNTAGRVQRRGGTLVLEEGTAAGGQMETPSQVGLLAWASLPAQ